MNAALSFAIPDQVSLWATNVLIHATVLTAISLLIALLFRKIAVMRYWVLWCGMLSVLGSPMISAVIQTRGNGWLTLAVPVADTPTADQVDASLPATRSQSEAAFRVNPDVAPADEPPVTGETVTPTPIAVQGAPPRVPAAMEPESGEQVRSAADWLRIVATPVMILWAIGTAILLVRMLTGWARLSRILRQAEPIQNAEWQQAFDRACCLVGCQRVRGPRLVVSDAVSGPIAGGVLGGTVVLPRYLVQQLHAADLADVLVHEVAHVVRRDQIVVLVQNLISAMYWPHPLVKVLNRELAKAREEVCDNFVLASSEAPGYSRTLLSVAQLVRRPETMPGSVGFFASHWKLEQRVAGLLDIRRDRTTYVTKRGWVFVAAVSAVLATLMCLGTVTMATGQSVNEDDSVAEVSSAISLDVSGIVRGPDSKPIPGARVMAIRHYEANTSWDTDSDVLAETASDDAGRYTLKFPSRASRFSNGQYLEVHETSVLAAFPGYGPDEQPVDSSQPEVNLKLAVAERPVRGRVIDLEGRPVAGVRVRLQRIDQPIGEGEATDIVGTWIEQAKANPVAIGKDEMMAMTGASSKTPISRFPAASHMHGVALLGRQVITDSDGGFQIDGVGDDRLAMLRMDGPTIASTLVPVVTRSMAPVNTPGHEPTLRNGKTFGNDFVFAAEPTQVVRGKIRDRMSGKPIAGATIELEHFADSQLKIGGFLSTTSGPDGKYVLSGLPKIGSQSDRSVRVGIKPPLGQPYFRSVHNVPFREGLDPIDFDIELTRGVWAVGQVTDATTGDPVSSIVGYHPYLDNDNADGHEAFDAGITSMGYDEMFATDANGNFRVPALKGRGVLRVVAAEPDDYEAVEVPGTKTNKAGGVALTNREIYHVIMPGNAVVDLNIADEAKPTKVDIELERLDKLTLRVLDPDGSDASGFYVAGRQDHQRLTSSGRGVSFWQRERSESSIIEVTLNRKPARDRPVILLNPERDLGAVIWLDEVPQDRKSPLTVRLQPCARIVGQLVNSDGEPITKGAIQAGVGGIQEQNETFVFEGGDAAKVIKRMLHPMRGDAVPDQHGRFEVVFPPGDRYSVIGRNMSGYPTLLENVTLAPGETIDVGTIDVTADPKTWPKPQHSTAKDPARSTRIKGAVFGFDRRSVADAMIAVVARRRTDAARTRMTTLAESTSEIQGFSIAIPALSADEYDSAHLIVRTADSALSFRELSLESVPKEVIIELKPAAPIRVRLVGLEGQPAANVQVIWRSVVTATSDGRANRGFGLAELSPWPDAAPPKLQTDEDGWLTVPCLSRDQGVLLSVVGDEQFAPQGIALNTGLPDERPEHDSTYRDVIKQVPVGETATITLLSAQSVAGQEVLGRTDEPAADAPSQRLEFGEVIVDRREDQ